MSTIDLSPRPLTDGAAAAARVFAKLRHDPAGIALTLGAPVVMVLLFGYVFGSAIAVPGSGDYREYLVPGLFVVIAVQPDPRDGHHGPGRRAGLRRPVPVAADQPGGDSVRAGRAPPRSTACCACC